MEFARRRRKKCSKNSKNSRKNRNKIEGKFEKKYGFSWPAAGEIFWDLGAG